MTRKIGIMSWFRKIMGQDETDHRYSGHELRVINHYYRCSKKHWRLIVRITKNPHKIRESTLYMISALDDERNIGHLFLKILAVTNSFRFKNYGLAKSLLADLLKGKGLAKLEEEDRKYLTVSILVLASIKECKIDTSEIKEPNPKSIKLIEVLPQIKEIFMLDWVE